MSQAKSANTTTTPEGRAVHFAALAAAVSPQWHEAILRLAKATERVSKKMNRFPKQTEGEQFVSRCRDLIRAMIDMLDELDTDADLEPTLAAWSIYNVRNGLSVEQQNLADECEKSEDDEPELGSFDRMSNQERAWKTVDRNPDIYGWAPTGGELDNCDYEPSLGSLDHNHSQEQWATGDRRDVELDHAESGTGDDDGLLEQIGTQDWQRGGMI